MTTASLAAYPLRLIGGLVDALIDPARRERAVVGLLFGYTAIWTLYAVVSKAAQGMHADPAEIVVWSRVLDWGTPKHGPLLPALVGAWFAVFPLTVLFYELLAVAMAALAIYVAWHLAGIWLDREKRALVPFLLMLVPSYNFLALKFDHNTALTVFWALATYAFMRSFLTRGWLWSTAVGITAAAALLTKYWSAVLLAGLVLAALLDCRRARYFRSPAPWIAVLVAALCLTPHIVWLVQHELSSLAHAIRITPEPVEGLIALLKFAGSLPLYLTVPFVLLAVLTRPSWAALADSALPCENDRRLVATAFWAPIGVALAGAIPLHIKLSSLWMVSAFSLAPVVLLSSPLVIVTRQTVLVFATAAIGLALAALCVSPIVAIATLRSGGEYDLIYVPAAVTEIERAWRATTERPLRIVGGTVSLANSAAFHLPDQPLAFPNMSAELAPWIDDARVAREGLVLICPKGEERCSAYFREKPALGSPTKKIEVELTPVWLAFTGPPKSFIIFTLAPRR